MKIYVVNFSPCFVKQMLNDGLKLKGKMQEQVTAGAKCLLLDSDYQSFIGVSAK